MSVFGLSVACSFLLLSIPEPGTAETCSLVLTPPSLVVGYGEPASANCSSLAQTNGMGWTAEQGGKDIEFGAQHLVWSVDSLTEWGVAPAIQCLALADEGGSCTIDLNVTIYKTPDSVSIRSVNHTGPMVEGSQYQLECEVQNVAPVQKLTVTWLRGETTLKEARFTDSNRTDVTDGKNVTVTDRLQITACRDDNGAQYKCVAELDLELDSNQTVPESASDPLLLTVLYGPKITCPPKVQVRDSEGLTCTVEGYPTPEVTWMKGEQEVDGPSHLSRTDGGRYTITARNSQGAVNLTMAVEILFGPEITCPNNIQVNESKALTCTIEGNPIPEVKWFKGKQEVDPLSHLGGADGGTYTIVAESTAGTVNHTISVEVIRGNGSRSKAGGCAMVVLLLLQLIDWL